MYKYILLACTLVASVVSGSKHHELEHPKLQQKAWNVAGTKALVKEFEGLYLKAYVCPAGVLTIGWGHTGPDVYAGMTITQSQAETYLTNDLQKFANCVGNYLVPNLNPNQVGALVSFSFNLGCGALQSSTLLRRLNAGEDPNTVAAQEFPRWVYAAGVKLAGLVRRRDAEVAFFKS